MQPLSGNQRPDLLTSLRNMYPVLRLPRNMRLSFSNVPGPPTLLKLLQNPYVLLAFGKVQNPLRLPRKTTSEPSKVVRAFGAFNMLTWKCASRHNGVHFFIIKTSKNGLRPSVFYTFRLRNALRATTVCNCSSLISAPAALASLLFGPPEPQIIGKHSASRLFYLFAHLHLLSSDSFSSLIFLLLFSSLL